MNNPLFTPLLKEVEKLHGCNQLAKTVTEDYYEPGMMEYLEQSEGIVDEAQRHILLRFESKGTRYGGRTEQIEKVHVGDRVLVVRDKENPYNPNNFLLLTESGKDIGNMPADLCNALAPVYDQDLVSIVNASVSFVDPISKRSRYAKQAVLFVKLEIRIML